MPVVTYVLIALNVLAYLAELLRPEIVDRFAMLGAGLLGPDGGTTCGSTRTRRLHTRRGSSTASGTGC